MGKRNVPKSEDVVYPQFLQIGSHLVAIEQGESPITTDEGEELYGYWQPLHTGGKIVVDDSLEGGRKLAVFLHEVLHAVSDTYGLELKHRQVYGAAEGLAQALHPWLKDLSR